MGTAAAFAAATARNPCPALLCRRIAVIAVLPVTAADFDRVDIPVRVGAVGTSVKDSFPRLASPAGILSRSIFRKKGLGKFSSSSRLYCGTGADSMVATVAARMSFRGATAFSAGGAAAVFRVTSEPDDELEVEALIAEEVDAVDGPAVMTTSGKAVECLLRRVAALREAVALTEARVVPDALVVLLSEAVEGARRRAETEEADEVAVARFDGLAGLIRTPDNLLGERGAESV